MGDLEMLLDDLGTGRGARKKEMMIIIALFEEEKGICLKEAKYVRALQG